MLNFYYWAKSSAACSTQASRQAAESLWIVHRIPAYQKKQLNQAVDMQCA